MDNPASELVVSSSAPDEIHRELRRLRRINTLSLVITVTIVLAVGTGFTFYPASSPTLTIVFALGSMVVALGPIGTLLEIAFAPRLWQRGLFLVGLLSVVVSWCLAGFGVAAGVAPDVALFSSLFVVVGGTVTLVLRWRDRRVRILKLERATSGQPEPDPTDPRLVRRVLLRKSIIQVGYSMWSIAIVLRLAEKLSATGRWRVTLSLQGGLIVLGVGALVAANEFRIHRKRNRGVGGTAE